jgi:hypothetical protein
MDYIYIDESGDLGKDSKYFVISAIISSNKPDLERIINKINRIFKKQLRNSNEIKGNNTPNYIIKKILKRLENIDYEAVIIVFNKENKDKIKYSNNNELYDIIASELAKMITIKQKTSIIIDKSKTKHSDIKLFDKYFIENLNNNLNFPIEISHLSSTNSKGLQIIDIISWSYFQNYEKNNEEFIKLIKNSNVKILFER